MVAPEPPVCQPLFSHKECDMIKLLPAVLLGLLAATPALAQPPLPTTHIVVRSPAGQRQLDQRLTAAAIEACGSAVDWDVPGKNAVRQCRAQVQAQLTPLRAARIAAATTPTVAIAAR
jgi:UrcA family protein